MKVITLTQPYASLVAFRAKHIETRSWSTSCRGPLAIHAAQGLGPVNGKRGLIELIETEPFWSVLREAFAVKLGGETHYPGDAETITNELPYGAIVAVCELVDCHQTNGDGYFYQEFQGRVIRQLSSQELAFGDYAPGRYAWLLGNIRALPEPIPCKGALGLWEYDGELGL